MLDSIYHMTLYYFEIIFWCENVMVLSYIRDVVKSFIS